MNTTSQSIVISLLVIARIGWADSLDTWTIRDSEATRNDLRGIVYANGEFVCVGAGGVIIASRDGISWERRASPTANALAAIIYGNSQFVAVGDAGTIISSSDGVNWAVRDSPSELTLVAVAYGRGQFVAVGGGVNPATSRWESTIVTSGNGVNWEREQPEAADGSAGLLGVAYGNGYFVAVGNLATAAGTASWSSFITASADGTNWVQQPVVFTNASLASITFGKGQFAAASRPYAGNTYVLTSPDGLHWTQHWPFIANLCGLACGNGWFVGTETGNLARSPDGVVWQEASPQDTPWDEHYTSSFYSIAYGDGKFVAVGDNGTIVSSSDLVNWVRRAPKELVVLSDVAYGGGRFVAVGDWYNTATSGWEAISRTSGDGAAWDTSHIGPGIAFNKIVFGNGRFVATGSWSNTLSGSAGTILSSSNGVNWIPTNPGPANELGAIAYGNGQFVAVGPDVQAVSTNGMDWVELPPSGFGVIAYGNGKFVGLPGSIRLGGWNAVTYGSGQFVSVGYFFDSAAVIQNSPDGVNWTLCSSGAPWFSSLEDIGYGNDYFVAVGQEDRKFLGWSFVQGSLIILSSGDGANWTRHPQPGAEFGASAVAYGNGHFVALGKYGAILQSGSIITLAISRNSVPGQLTLSLTGPTGVNYTVESSTDLMSWRTVTNVTSTQPTTVISTAVPATLQQAFYRAYGQ